MALEISSFVGPVKLSELHEPIGEFNLGPKNFFLMLFIAIGRRGDAEPARKMPLFGSRMVCQTASYKYIEERDRKFAERENKLARYVRA